MNNRAEIKPITLSIAAVERDTGLSKDTLRVWERRYGFPSPERDSIGERAYPLEQVEKLRIIKRLMDAGHRPGRIVPMAIDELQRLTESTVDSPQRVEESSGAPDLRMYVDLVREHDMDSLRRQLTQAQVRLGLGRFVTEVIAPLNTRVGDAWMRGQMEIFEEHMYTEAVQVVLRSAIGSVPDAARSGRPRVLLTTFPGEPHGLGLLMAEAIFALEGARCLSLGVQTPIWDIVLAAGAHRADIVALGFTGCMNPNQVVEGLGELRSKLPRQMEIWAGGTAPVLHRRTVEGVVPIASLAAVQPEVQRWREAAV
ncbi:MAG: MerR family transcriptional regulator [Ideonella sp.]|nr:MerR family transcriptional regulator [Ideonella sp.]